MLTPGVLGTFMIFLIPIVAIVAFTYRSYLKHTSEGPANKQIVSDLIDTVEELANRLEATRAERDAMRQRLQNLETIVTSEAWDERSLPSTASLDAQASTAQASTNDIARADATGAPASANASPQDRGRASTTDGGSGNASKDGSGDGSEDGSGDGSGDASAGGPGAGSTGDTSRTSTPLLDRPEHDPDASSADAGTSETGSSSADRAADLARRLRDNR